MRGQKHQLELIKSKGRACTCANLRQAARAVTQLYDEMLRPTGLRVTQFGILAAALTMEPVTVTRLAEVTVTDRTTLTRNLKLIEKQGLIRVTTGHDRREREVTLTDKGRETLAKAIPHWEKAQSYMIERFGQKRWRTLMGELSAIVAVARRA